MHKYLAGTRHETELVISVAVIRQTEVEGGATVPDGCLRIW